jgi:hypothetical protein
MRGGRGDLQFENSAGKSRGWFFVFQILLKKTWMRLLQNSRADDWNAEHCSAGCQKKIAASGRAMLGAPVL